MILGMGILGFQNGVTLLTEVIHQDKAKSAVKTLCGGGGGGGGGPGGGGGGGGVKEYRKKLLRFFQHKQYFMQKYKQYFINPEFCKCVSIDQNIILDYIVRCSLKIHEKQT